MDTLRSERSDSRRACVVVVAAASVGTASGGSTVWSPTVHAADPAASLVVVPDSTGPDDAQRAARGPASSPSTPTRIPSSPAPPPPQPPPPPPPNSATSLQRPRPGDSAGQETPPARRLRPSPSDSRRACVVVVAAASVGTGPAVGTNSATSLQRPRNLSTNAHKFFRSSSSLPNLSVNFLSVFCARNNSSLNFSTSSSFMLSTFLSNSKITLYAFHFPVERGTT